MRDAGLLSAKAAASCLRATVVVLLCTAVGGCCVGFEAPPRSVWSGPDVSTLPLDMRHRALLASLEKSGARIVDSTLELPAKPSGTFFRHVRVPVRRAARYRVVALGVEGSSTRMSLWQHGAFLAEDASPGRDASVAWDSFGDGTATVGVASTAPVRLVLYEHGGGRLALPLDRGAHADRLEQRLAEADLQLRRLGYAPLLEPERKRGPIEFSFRVRAGACYGFAARGDGDDPRVKIDLDLPAASRTQQLRQARVDGVAADFACAAADGRASLRTRSTGVEAKVGVLVYRRHDEPRQWSSCQAEACGNLKRPLSARMRVAVAEGYEPLFAGSLPKRGKPFTLPANRCAAFATESGDPHHRLRVETVPEERWARRDRWERSYADPRWIHLCAGEAPLRLKAYTVDVDPDEDFPRIEPVRLDVVVLVRRFVPVRAFRLGGHPALSPGIPPPREGLILE
ncbi:MAG: hypothetical protein AAGA56_27525 [Myxococcota bacterium]